MQQPDESRMMGERDTKLPAASMIGRRYQLQETIGVGGMGTVYRAYDRLKGQMVALKRVLPPTDSHMQAAEDSTAMRVALAQEFKLLASIRHPNVIGVLDYGFDAQRQPYFTMELLNKAQSILEAGYKQSRETQIDMLIQVLQALAYLHRREILHHDLKPRNVLVADGQVKVLDFGLSLMSEAGKVGIQQMAGTLAYMAPELLLGAPASEASDLYALGVIAYELMTGRYPFEGETASMLIDNILMAPPDFTLGDLDPRIAAVLARLLAKLPADRYASANEAILALCDSIGLTVPTESAATRDSFLQAARLVGRTHEMEQLSAALDEALMGKGSVWLIGGESGVGKSRLLDELRVQALVRGALVVSGQAVSEGGLPYQLWCGPLRWLSLLTELDDNAVGLLKTAVPDIETLLGRTVTSITAEPQAIQSRLLAVIENMIRSQAQPTVIILEDLHWANNASLNMLARLYRLAANLPLLIIGDYRDDERPDLPTLFPGVEVMSLPRLSEQGIAELSEAMLGQVGRSPDVVALLHRETEGNVFFLVEVVRALAEEAGDLASIGQTTLPQQVFASGMRRIVQRRLNRVPGRARQFLQLAAVLGRELDIPLLRAAAPSSNVDYWLLVCAEAAILEVQDERWRFAHDKLREGVLIDLDPAERQKLHRTAALAIEATYPNMPGKLADLAHHWAMAGDIVKEQHYLTRSGEQALYSGAYREAINLFERALALASPANLGNLTPRRSTSLLRRQIHLRHRMADALLGLGDYARAGQSYDESLKIARLEGNRPAIAETLARLGDVFYAQEVYAEANANYQNSLTLYRELNDQPGIARVLNSLGNVAFELGNDTEARRLYQESLALSREIGQQWGMAGSFSNPMPDPTDE